MIVFALLAIGFALVGVAALSLAIADLAHHLGEWRRTRIRQAAKLKQPGRRWS